MVDINAPLLTGDLVGSDGDDTFVGNPLGIGDCSTKLFLYYLDILGADLGFNYL